MRSSACAITAAVVLITRTAQAQTIPVLHYDPPANTYRSASTPPDDYSFNQFNASVQVYPFRPAIANIFQTFQATLLNEWIAPMHREENVAAGRTFQPVNIPGAQGAVLAMFSENRVGILRPHNRLLILAGGSAAIVDASAPGAETWRMAVPTLNAMIRSLRVDATQAPPSTTAGPGPAGRAVAGLYQGSKGKYMVNLSRPVGFGDWITALHFYLFSADGHVYRAYDRLPVQDNDPSRFDFDTIARNDPVNSGRYTVQDNQLYIRMSGPAAESIVAPVPSGGRLTINSIVYMRQ